MRAISRVPHAKVVGIVDADLSRAQALCERWKTGRPLSAADDLFQEGVDVVHVLTPPSSHATLTVAALEHGCHAYVEKPLAISAEDCDRIAAAAKDSGKSVCVGHSFLRDPTLARALKLVESGAIGQPLAVQYTRFTKYPKYAGGRPPEMYREGGYPFRDMGVHGLYIIESILGQVVDASPTVTSTGSDASLHCDEWTVALNCERGQATVHLSWNIRPQQHVITIEGTQGVLRADLYSMYVSQRRSRRIPEHAVRIVNSLSDAAQMASGTLIGVAGFALGRVRQYHGLQNLVEEFYQTLREGRTAPVVPEQARSVVFWTESLAREGDRQKRDYLAASCPQPTAKTLVTGATGLIGRRLVDRLLETQRPIRLLVRRMPKERELADNPLVEILLGDLGDPDVVDRAVAGTTTIYHLGAALRGTTEEFDRGTIVGTRNIVESALRHNVEKLVYVSSLSVLHALAGDDKSIITEEWPLEPSAKLRGDYSRTKLEAERIVCDAVREKNLRAILLRPAEVLDDGGPRLTAGLALRLGKRLCVLGDGQACVPLVYVGDVVDALLLAESSPVHDGSIFHLVDPAEKTQNELLDCYLRASHQNPKIMHLPRWIVGMMGRAGDVLTALTRRRMPVTSYRLNSALARRRFNCDRAAKVLHWTPRVGVERVLQNRLAPADLGRDERNACQSNGAGPVPDAAYDAGMKATAGSQPSQVSSR